MIRYLFPLAAILFVSTLQGCATASTVANAELDLTNTQTFEADIQTVENAATQGLVQLELNLKEVKSTPTGKQIIFSKPISGWSWGEVGRIDLTKLSATSTRVAVQSEKRYQIQITGTEQDEFAKNIFAEIKKNLN